MTPLTILVTIAIVAVFGIAYVKLTPEKEKEKETTPRTDSKDEDRVEEADARADTSDVIDIKDTRNSKKDTQKPITPTTEVALENANQAKVYYSKIKGMKKADLIAEAKLRKLEVTSRDKKSDIIQKLMK